MLRSECAPLTMVLLCLAALAAFASAQPARTPSITPSSNDALMAELMALRDSFVNQIKAEGFKVSMAPPAIVLDNPPSYGNYDDNKNLLHIAVWSALSPDDQARFSKLADMLGEGRTGEQAFGDGIHHWVFVHELGHWWQACQHQTGDTHYATEYGANRIAAAYWRRKDPEFMRRTEKKMTTVIAVTPNPVPNGQSKEKYFNDNYDKLAGTRAYIWYQYDMVLNVQGEKPLPSFRESLQRTVYP
jgi:hypothetical protein